MSTQFKQDFQKLVKAGDKKQALQFAKDYLTQHPRELEAWWYIATQVSIPKFQKQCCRHILKVDPSFHEAQALLDQLSQPEPPKNDYIANPLGLPQDDAPSVKPFKPIFVEEEEKSEKPWEDLDPSPAKPLNKTRLLIFTVLTLIILWGGAGAVYYFFFYNPEPSYNLSETTGNSQFDIKYPEEWSTRAYDDGRVLIANRSLSAIENTASANPWRSLDPQSGGFSGFTNFFLDILFTDTSQEIIVVTMQPIPQDATQLVQDLAWEADSIYDRNLITYDFDITPSEREIRVGSETGQIITLDIIMSETLSLGNKRYMQMSFLPVFHNNQYYLFTFTAGTQREKDWQTVLTDFVQNIEFKS